MQQVTPVRFGLYGKGSESVFIGDGVTTFDSYQITNSKTCGCPGAPGCTLNFVVWSKYAITGTASIHKLLPDGSTEFLQSLGASSSGTCNLCAYNSSGDPNCPYCDHVQIGYYNTNVVLPAYKDCGDVPFRIYFSEGMCGGDLIIYGPQGWDFTGIIVPETGGAPYVDLVRGVLDHVCVWGNNYNYPPDLTAYATCPSEEGGTVPIVNPPRPPQPPACVCGGGASGQYPSEQDCPKKQNVILATTGTLGASDATCTCYQCVDKCTYYSWDPPTGWQAGITTCDPSNSLEINTHYQPSSSGGYECTISRCNDCWKEYGVTASCGIPIRDTEPCLLPVYLGTVNGKQCWTSNALSWDGPPLGSGSAGPPPQENWYIDQWCDFSPSGFYWCRPPSEVTAQNPAGCWPLLGQFVPPILPCTYSNG